jgi:type IV secretory pathway TrbL component
MTKTKGDTHDHRSDIDLNEQSDADDERTIAALREGLHTLERLIPASMPSQTWLLQQIKERKAYNRKWLIRDLIVFVLVAVVILSLLITATVRIPSLFMVMQLASFVIAPLVLMTLQRKRVKG